MLNNVGMFDRFLRLIAASVFLYLGLYVYAGTAIAIALDVAGGLALFTGLLGSCALYGVLGLNTRKSDQSY
jgi:hypothetical protein